MLSLSMADVATMPRSSHPLSTGGPDLRRRVNVSVFAGLAVLGIVSCSSSDGATPPHKNTTAVSPTTTPPETTPDPLAGYTPEEVQAYQEALAAYRHFQSVKAHVYAVGRATPQALRQLKSVEFGSLWPADWQFLKTIDLAGITLSGYNLPLSKEVPARVVLSQDGTGSVSIKMCTDPRGIREHYPSGKVTPLPGNNQPSGETVTLDRFPDGPWKLSTAKTWSGASC
jgi:hypothetical protein